MKINQLIKDLLAKAINQNILCYCNEDESNLLTTKFINILLTNLDEYYNDNIAKIYIDDNIVVDPKIALVYPEIKIQKVHNLTGHYYIIDKDLALAPNDNEVILVIGHNNTQILGSC